ncbi:MAG TPA: cupredoxin domain-containing protein [Actinomycetota bacterium]|nr:cupredoxin domain-containing protein [Actinomycetota bacterium]
MNATRGGARWAAVVLALAVGAVACGGGTSGGGSTGGGGGSGEMIRLSDGQEAANHGTGRVSGTTAEVELGDFYFAPTILEGPAGAEVTLTLRNAGQALHNFEIPDQDVDVDVQPGQEATVTVTFPSSGAVTFECKYHVAQGMRGELRAL